MGVSTKHRDEQIAFPCSLCPVLELHLGYVGAVHWLLCASICELLQSSLVASNQWEQNLRLSRISRVHKNCTFFFFSDGFNKSPCLKWFLFLSFMKVLTQPLATVWQKTEVEENEKWLKNKEREILCVTPSFFFPRRKRFSWYYPFKNSCILQWKRSNLKP